MKRLQIMIEEDLDETLARMALEEGASKAAIIRRTVRANLAPLPPLTADPLRGMLGVDDFEPADIDEIVYG